MAAAPQLSVTDQIRQLEGARKLVFKDVSYYPQVIQATVPIIGPSSQLEFRRWGADFLAEAFATPALPLSSKETLSLVVLDTLKSLLEDPAQDVLVLRSVIQTAASIYPLAMRWIINNSYDTTTWEKMTAIKTKIRDIWDTAPPTVRICCIKFVQRVILAHTSSVNLEPRRGDPLDISRNMVPPNHSILDGDQLEAEASGLLDRMLGTLDDENTDPLIIDATLNTLSILVRQRPTTSNRIVSTLFNFNPLRLATNATLTPKTKVLVKSMEKTTRMLLTHLYRRDPQNPLAGRMQQYVEHLARSRAEIFDETGQKRAALDQLNVVEPKRLRPTLSTQPQIEITPLKPGANSLADLYTFTTNEGLKNFSVRENIPAQLAARISVRTIAQLDTELLERAINGIRSRLLACYEAAQQPFNPETAPLDVEDDDDDDYEPDYHAAEDTEQLLNKLDSSPPDERRDLEAPVLGALALPAFKLPPPPILDPEQATKVGQGVVARVFCNMKTLDESTVKKSKAGLNRLAASSYDRDSWITVLTRLATRSNASLDKLPTQDDGSTSALPTFSMGDTLREMLYTYVLEDFRKRIDVAVTWLSEEWYNERLQSLFVSSHERCIQTYEKWTLRLIDAFLPYLHAQDKVLTRFLSELPELTVSILSRVTTLCRDPSLVNLALTSLYYLVMFRPPARNIALDTVQDIWTTYEDARPVAAKYLQKWRPGFIEAAQRNADGDDTVSANGTVVAT